MSESFDELIAEGESEPTEGWDFSWFDGRATEERPPWGYARLVADRMARASMAADLQTGGGEVLATIPIPPPRLIAVEGWPPNLPVARRNLEPLGALVVQASESGELPLASGAFDLVISRHPIIASWAEIARVLEPGGTYLSQEIGPATNRELSEFFMGSLPADDSRSSRRAAEMAAAAGLDVVDRRDASLTVRFFDVGAVVYFLRKVVWTVPDFSVGRYRDRLATMHEYIGRNGSFVSHAQRFLIEAVKRR